MRVSDVLENSKNKSPIGSKRKTDLFFNTRNNIKSELICSSGTFVSSLNNMGVYNELAKKLKSNKTYNSNKNSREISNKKSKIKSPDLKSFSKIKSYNQSFSNFDNILTSGNSTFTNLNKTKSRINSACARVTNADLSQSSSNLKRISNKISSNEIEGPEELHFFNVILSQNNKNLAYKFEHFEPIEDFD